MASPLCMASTVRIVSGAWRVQVTNLNQPGYPFVEFKSVGFQFHSTQPTYTTFTPARFFCAYLLRCRTNWQYVVTYKVGLAMGERKMLGNDKAVAQPTGSTGIPASSIRSIHKSFVQVH